MDKQEKKSVLFIISIVAVVAIVGIVTMVLQYSGGSSAAPMKEGSAGIGQKEFAGMALSIPVDEIIDENVPKDEVDTAELAAYCKDPDGGKDAFMATTIEYMQSTGIVNTKSDSCQTKDQAIEWYCDGIKPQQEFVDCKYGCCNGACMTSATICGSDLPTADTGDDVKIPSVDQNCKDNNPVHDPYVRGSLSLGLTYVEDGCANDQQVEDFFCDTTSSYSSKTFLCKTTQSCEDGICKFRTCTDSDGGSSPSSPFMFDVKGTVTQTGVPPRTDFCNSDGTIAEQTCDSTDHIQTVTSACPTSSICDDGACVSNTCTDTDGGMVIGTEGTVYATGNIVNEDTCVNSSILHEQFCDENNNPVSTLFPCPSGHQCIGGECKSVACSDTDGGDDNSVMGYISVLGQNVAVDYCHTINTNANQLVSVLVEQICLSDGTYRPIVYQCNCQNGACV